MQSLEWLEKNAYKDEDQDWWETEADYNEWDDADGYDGAHLFYGGDEGAIWDTERYLKESKESKLEWAVELVYTKETHPERFL